MSTEIVTTNSHAPSTWGYLGNSMESAGKLATALVKTGLAPQGMTPGQAFYILLAGAELGLRGPVEALRHVVVIKGKPSISAELMRAMLLAQGCKVSWLRSDSTGATIKITRPDGSVGTFSFTEDDARRAGLLGQNTWKMYPTSMYQARVTSLAARAFCPDMLRGASYTPEELGVKATVTGEGDVEYLTPTDADVTDPEDDPEPSRNGSRRDDEGGSPALPEEPALASTAQVKALAILATKKLGGISREARLAMYAEIIGREIETSSDLTPGEWRKVVDALNGMEAIPATPRKAKGEGSPTSEAKAAGAGESLAPTPADVAQTGEELWGEPVPDWKRLTSEQSAVRNSIVKLAATVQWVNVETKQVLAPESIRECFTVDPGPWANPEVIATRPAPRRMLALYQEEVEKERERLAAESSVTK